jgi:hypothetical protein
MGPAYFVIAIMGCGDGAVDCQTVATPAAHYSTEQACLAARNDVLVANSDLDFPTLLAQCQAVAPRATAAKPKDAPKDAAAA